MLGRPDAPEHARILLVDDTPANLVALESVLAGPGHELVSARSGAEALRFLLSNQCALILLDVQMPELDGYETAHLIRRNERTRNIPIVFLTAHGADEPHVRKGYESGAIDYVFKPFDPAVLRSKVEAFVRLDRAQRQLLAQEEQLREAQRREHAHTLAQIELRSLRRQEAAQRRYRALVDGVTHAVAWVADPLTLAPKLLSPSASAILGRAPEQSIAAGLPLIGWIHADDREEFAQAARALEPGADARVVQHRAVRPDGQEVWLDTALRLLPSESGEGLELHGFSVDVTERRRARRALELLARAGEDLVRSLECADTAAAVARAAVPELADWCAVEVIAGAEPVVAASHDDPALAAAAAALAATAPVRTPRAAEGAAGSILELPLSGRGRRLGVLRLFSAPGRVPAGPRERQLAEDLGRRAAQAIENALLYLEAREAVRVREDFLSIASHELRTPLGALTLQMRLLEGAIASGKLALPPAAAADLKRRVETGVRQVDRLTKLVNSLLDLARIRSGEMRLELEEFDLRDLVRDIGSRYEEALAKEARALALEGGAPVVGRWDRSRLDQLVTNLVANAVKYGGSGPIAVSVSARGGWASLSVRDAGPGIPPDDLGRIFERFVQGASGRSTGGLGLGLYISRKIAEAHGGRIRAESPPGGGTTFVVELPCEPRRAEAAAEDDAPGPSPADDPAPEPGPPAPAPLAAEL